MADEKASQASTEKLLAYKHDIDAELFRRGVIRTAFIDDLFPQWEPPAWPWQQPPTIR